MKIKRPAKAGDWLVERQILDLKGDWSEMAPDLRPGGWAFQYWNDYYPDVDDTALVVMALLHRIIHTNIVNRLSGVLSGLLECKVPMEDGALLILIMTTMFFNTHFPLPTMVHYWILRLGCKRAMSWNACAVWLRERVFICPPRASVFKEPARR